MGYIDFNDITLTFQTKIQRIPIFKHFTNSVEKGVFTTIYGASGKGKSTLLNLVAGLVKPNTGTICVDGQNISHFHDKELCRYRNKKIGYIFQAFHLIPELTVADNIAVPLRMAGIHKKQALRLAEEALEQVGMGNRKKEYPYTLSGGEQQRVACARALINNPSIILADEPTGNLDSRTGENIIAILKSAQKEMEATVLCVSHDPRLIEQGDVRLNIETYTQAQ